MPTTLLVFFLMASLAAFSCGYSRSDEEALVARIKQLIPEKEEQLAWPCKSEDLPNFGAGPSYSETYATLVAASQSLQGYGNAPYRFFRSLIGCTTDQSQRVFDDCSAKAESTVKEGLSILDVLDNDVRKKTACTFITEKYICIAENLPECAEVDIRNQLIVADFSRDGDDDAFFQSLVDSCPALEADKADLVRLRADSPFECEKEKFWRNRSCNREFVEAMYLADAARGKGLRSSKSYCLLKRQRQSCLELLAKCFYDNSSPLSKDEEEFLGNYQRMVHFISERMLPRPFVDTCTV